MSGRRAQPADLARIRVPAEPTISPDGGTIVYTVRNVDPEADARRSSLWRVSTDPAGDDPPVRLTTGPVDSAPAFAPDGQQLAFLRAGPGGPAQLWLLPAGPGEPRPLTELPGGAGAPVWSPDGSRLAFVAPVGQGQPEHAPIVADRLRYKQDGVGWWRDRRRHVFVVEVATGEVRQLTQGDWHAGAPAWSPDGERLTFPVQFTTPDDDLTGESETHVLELATGARRSVFRGVAGPSSWTPTGDAVLVVGRRRSRPGHDRLWRVPEPAGEPAALAAALDRNIMPGARGYPGGLPQFTRDGDLLFCARDRGCTQLYTLDRDLAGPARRLLGGDGGVVSALSVARAADRAAVVVAGPDSTGEVAVVELPTGALTVLTDHQLPDVAWLTPQERVFEISDGRQVHGWLLRDPAARTPAPLLLDIHGGPHNAWSPEPSPGRFYRQLLAARGWAVLLLNPRGSDGYGEEFYTAAVGGWGIADEPDFLEPIDTLVAEGVADPDRLAVTGYSYGGFMTCWLTGRTDRFAAAVTGGPVADLASMAGTSDAGHWLAAHEIGALPYQDPAALAAQSPYRLVGEVSTPTLILQGAADDRCPPGQGEQWFAALRGRQVPTQLVLYPGASHLFLLDGRPSHRVDYCQRVVDWVTRYTTPSLADGRDRWERRLAELAERFRVPGAVLGVARGESRLVVATGVANVETGVEVTPTTRFQIGSVTKVLTATVLLRLVDEGRLDLDKPVASYLSELALADPAAAGTLTLRHLLSHTSGIDGDVFTDHGRGDDCLARYVAGLAQVPQLFQPGALFSYCNAGYGIAGRIIEVLTGQSWDVAMRELLFDPAGLTGVATLPEQAILHRAAVGHVHEGDESPRRAEVWSLPRALASFGGTPCATADDLLTFAQLHLAGGVAAGGQRLLSAEAVAAMQAEQVRLPDRYATDSYGLGWRRFDWHGTRLAGHDGATIGQFSYLRVLPDHDLAVVLLTNGGAATDLAEALLSELVGELTGVAVPAPVTPPESVPTDAGRYAGVYQRIGVRYEVSAERLRIVNLRDTPGLTGPPKEFALRPIDEQGAFAIRAPGEQTWQRVTFGALPTGERYLHHALRATPKVA